jgi:hypothetical protein
MCSLLGGVRILLRREKKGWHIIGDEWRLLVVSYYSRTTR